MRTAGIDVGSSAIKVAVMEDLGNGGAKLLGTRIERIRKRDPRQVADEAIDGTLADAGVRRDELDYIATTGEGELIEYRTGHFYGMTTHARGGLFLDPEARAVIDIGALHTRAVLMDDRAKVLGYRMTSQCASGSGQFLENISRYLGVTLDEIGPLSLEADDPEVCSSICAVLAETDVINMVSRGISTSNILKGIHQSMAGRYVRLLVAAGAREVTLVTGGLAADVGLVRAIEEAIEGQAKAKTLVVRRHPDSVHAGAIGAALWGAYRARVLRERGVVFGSETSS
ncbi:MAG: benzoyl-CoA reductase subunit D [Planctomycetes bacterium]|nr:benzoyl-CoA reductase subunit D [Planctomycetota bacterium]